MDGFLDYVGTAGLLFQAGFDAAGIVGKALDCRARDELVLVAVPGQEAELFESGFTCHFRDDLAAIEQLVMSDLLGFLACNLQLGLALVAGDDGP